MNLHIYRFGRPLVGQVEQQQQQHLRTRFFIEISHTDATERNV